MIRTIQELRKHAEMVQGLWNGDNSGRLEDAYGYAQDILDALDKIEETLPEIEGLDESDVTLN